MRWAIFSSKASAPRRALRVWPALLCLVVGAGCPSDRNYCSNQTTIKLKELVELVAALEADGHDILAITSVPDMLAKARHTGRLPDDGYYERKLKTDGWEQPFLWTTRILPERATVEIISYGPNRRFDDGFNDDLVETYTLRESTAGPSQ